MKTNRSFRLGLFLLAAPCVSPAATHVLVFTSPAAAKSSAATARERALRQLATERGWQLDATGKRSDFNAQNLSRHDVVVWSSGFGDGLNAEEQSTFQGFCRAGKGIVAVDENGLAPVRLVSRAPLQRGTMIVQERTHPATFLLPRRWEFTAEWPNYSALPADARVLIAVDEGSYQPGGDALEPRLPSHPIAWFREPDGGRFFYVGLGHRSEDCSDARFLSLLAGAVEWAAGKMSNPVEMATDGPALILREFDGHAPNGRWERQTPPAKPQFTYEVSPGSLRMHDDDPSRLNQHLVRAGIAIDPRRPYAIEGKFTIPAPLHANAANSFAVNFNVAGQDGDTAPINTWSLNVDLHGPHGLAPDAFSLGGLTGTYGGVLRFMGFERGRFTEIGHMEASWGAPDVEYAFRIYVNAALNGRTRDKLVSMVVFRGDLELEKFQIDYSAYPYQPDYSRPVRFGFNTHGANWILRDLKLYYLDVPIRRP